MEEEDEAWETRARGSRATSAVAEPSGTRLRRGERVLGRGQGEAWQPKRAVGCPLPLRRCRPVVAVVLNQVVRIGRPEGCKL